VCTTTASFKNAAEFESLISSNTCRGRRPFSQIKVWTWNRFPDSPIPPLPGRGKGFADHQGRNETFFVFFIGRALWVDGGRQRQDKEIFPFTRNKNLWKK
jgi:hypothetical protein